MKPSDIQDRLARVVGSEAKLTTLVNGPVMVAPKSESACTSILRTATTQAWKVRIASHTDQSSYDAPADLILTTEHLDTISDIKPADLFATAGSGVTIREMGARFAESGMWLAVDPPGTDGTIGAVAATGAAGSLQTGYGPVRDQILGMTVITPTGRTIVAGGRVVKNVAGYDIPKMIVGSFGAFGMITKVHLRLRVTPEKDVTLTARGTCSEMLRLKRGAELSTVTSAAMELRSADSNQWVLAVRLLGSASTVDRGVSRLARATDTNWQTTDQDAAIDLWSAANKASSAGPTTIRLGPNDETLGWTIAALRDAFANGHIAVSGIRNVVRWSGETHKTSIASLRAQAATHSVPVTIEHAPWPVLESEGHFGELRTGVAPLVAALRASFDPNNTLVVPLEAKRSDNVQ